MPKHWLAFAIFTVGCSYASPINDADGCRGYQEPSQSRYVLPYAVGQSYVTSQGNCGYTHRTGVRFSYDWAMSRGDEIVAMRYGLVKTVNDTGKDGQREASPNYLEIEHNDGSVARYTHIKQDSVTVSKGDLVKQGDPIAAAGHTHLHVDVRKHNRSIPITFRNTKGGRFGLVAGEEYEALSYTPDEK